MYFKKKLKRMTSSTKSCKRIKELTSEAVLFFWGEEAMRGLSLQEREKQRMRREENKEQSEREQEKQNRNNPSTRTCGSKTDITTFTKARQSNATLVTTILT